MSQLSIITSRNLKQYLRDKGAIFFSLLSMFIVILLMFFFLGDSNTNSITDLLSQFLFRIPLCCCFYGALFHNSLLFCKSFYVL